MPFSSPMGYDEVRAPRASAAAAAGALLACGTKKTSRRRRRFCRRRFLLCKKGRSGADLGEGVVDSFHDALAGEGRAGGRIHFGGLGCDDGVGNGLESRVGDARGLAVGQDLDLADLVAVHSDCAPDWAAEALALADILVVSQ